MDEQHSPAPRSIPPTGGTVEPTKRAAVAKDRAQPPGEDAGERYELRDPFADVTYRAKSFAEIAAKAEQLGSSRFTAVAADGKRTPVTKSDGQWHRGPQLAALPERPLDAMSGRDEPDAPTEITKARAEKPTNRAPPGKSKALAKIEANAERSALVAKLEAALIDRYVIKRAPVTLGALTVGHTEYRFRGDTSRVAFTESTFRLATDTNSPSVARSMVDVAQARNWQGLRISGSEDFRRLVWIEASVRGVKAIGYEPNPADLDILRREREARQSNRIDATRGASAGTSSIASDKATGRGGGTRKTVIAAIEAILVAKRVPEAKRTAVLAAATEQLAQRAKAGQTAKVKVYDMAAPSRQPRSALAAELGRSRDRAIPTPAR